MANKRTIVAITACAAGVAHTYMAAESLEKKAIELGYKIHVETQGTIGIENEIPTAMIAEADIVIIASDVKIDTSRFNGKRVYECGVNPAIKNPEGLIDDAYLKATVIGGKGTEKGFVVLGAVKKQGILNHLMTGISWMLPITISAGLLMAMANLMAFQTEYMDNYGDYGENWVLGTRIYPQFLMNVGGLGFKLMIPFFSAFIAYSIADRPGIAAGLMAGWIINDNSMLDIHVQVSPNSVIEPGAGFIGAIITGVLSGYFVKGLKGISWPRFLRPIVPIMLIPIISVLVMTSLTKFVIGVPIANLVLSMFDGLSEIQEKFAGTQIVIAIILSAMIAFDLGGPFNKTALVFGTVVFYQTLAEAMSDGRTFWDANFVPGTATQAAIGVPPLGMWLSSLIFKNKYTRNERVMGYAAFGTGMVGITEGAIPFTAADPIRIIFANVCGSIVAGVGVTLTNAKFAAGLGSPLGTFLGYIKQDNFPFWPMAWILPIILGVIVTACIAGLLKRKITGEEYQLLLEDRQKSRERRARFRIKFKLMFTNPKIFFTNSNKESKKYFKNLGKGSKIYWTNIWINFANYFIGWGRAFKKLGLSIASIFRKKTDEEKQARINYKTEVKSQSKEAKTEIKEKMTNYKQEFLESIINENISSQKPVEK